MKNLVQNVQIQKVIKTINDLRETMDKRISISLGLGITIAVIGFKLLRNKGDNQQSPQQTSEVVEKQSQNSNNSEENDIIEIEENKQLEKQQQQQKQSEPRQKKKQIIQKINQKTKKQFQTDNEMPAPKIILEKQNSIKQERNADDKLFFQIYQKMNQEVSNEDS
ncbi:unnamed protein product (macronuclear) [Paramecium tetraurelia]|uniref:Uncharacterized protein n=1 Tax=Paramecium tetraurelia TaxID=5888 RepID=A0E6Y3_PARTE|nr:uncharacterized protein GSPATT00023778001 [Paramecium tetraurelia]CAK91050.1 unnamed protein product [Paramecium tetraurelia]|eukprot:XP_001458447.1 hypothetical protein (macronuclear) [Paramecium tetraurelia strain d4-2]